MAAERTPLASPLHIGWTAQKGKDALTMAFILLVLSLPLLEVAGFVLVGQQIGVLATVLLVILSAMVGVGLTRSQGMETLRRAQERAARREPPLEEAFDGLCVALAGVLLIIPGFVSDVAGLLLFLPPVRRMLYRQLASRAVVVTRTGDPRRPAGPVVIEADWTELPPGNAGELPPSDSRWRPPGRP